MKQQQDHLIPEQKQRGQSLVEVALFLPILIIIIAGVVEVSQLLLTQNRVDTASRAAARFGANGGEDEGMRRVVLGNVTQTLDLDEALWDVWVVRGQINEDGNAITDWEFTHIYGISNTVRYDAVDEDVLRQRVLDELSVDGRSAATLRFVGNYVQHDVDTILGLDNIPVMAGYNSISSLNVMRITGQTAEATRGCDAFPIAVERTIRSVTEPGTGGGNPYPDAGDFWPNNFNSRTYESFTRHQADVPLNQAKEGYVYRIWNGGGPGNFGWLSWNTGINPSQDTLAQSLLWPGNSQDYHDHGDGGQQATPHYQHVVRGFVNAIDSTDISMNIGDWVSAVQGVVNSSEVRSTMLEHTNKERTLRLIVFNDKTGTGNNTRYQIDGFATFKLHGHNLTQGQGGGWVLAEFISWDDSCGQTLD
jgi:hypothetical protein